MNDSEKFRYFSVINDFLRQHKDYTPDNREEYEIFKKQLLDLNKPLKNMNTRDLLVRKKNTQLKNMYIETRERFHVVERKERSKGLVNITSPKVKAYLDEFNLVKTAANTPLPQPIHSPIEIEQEEEPEAVSCKSCFGIRRKTKKKGKKSYDEFYGGKRRLRKKKTRKKNRNKRGGRKLHLFLEEINNRLRAVESGYGDIASNTNNIALNAVNNLKIVNQQAIHNANFNDLFDSIGSNQENIALIRSFINHKGFPSRSSDGRTTMQLWERHLNSQRRRGENTRELRDSEMIGGGGRRKKKTRKKRGSNGKKKKVKKGVVETDGKGLPEYPYIQIDNPPKEWKMEGGRRKKKTRKKRGGEKSKKIKKLTKIFQQYPKIFPSGYFRFLAARLENHINKNTLWYRNGVVLTWIKYQKTVKKNDKCIIKPGDVKLDQIVNKNQGNGAAKKVVMQFLKKFEKNRIWLEVRANNKRAIKFYRKNGFKKVCNIKFGEIPGIMMVKN